MVQLSLFEEVKDKASRLLPTPYMDMVEECTAPILSVPTYEHVMFLTSSANRNADTVVDIVRAIRRRIAHDEVAVKHLTVLLLEYMVKNCGVAFHVEFASQKGLLRELVRLAVTPPTCARGVQAKSAALNLALTLSIGFASYPDARCHILATLADDVRAEVGPNAFEGLKPDTNFHIQMNVSPTDRKTTSPHKIKRDGDRSKRNEKRIVRDAIAVNLPTEAQLTTMLDTCVALSEYINNMLAQTDGKVVSDDVITGFAHQVREDYERMTVLLGSNLQVDRDVIRSVSDSQASVLHRIKSRDALPLNVSQATQPSPAPPPETIVSDSEEPPCSQVTMTYRTLTTHTSAPSVPNENMTACLSGSGVNLKAGELASAAPVAPSMEDIFGPPVAVDAVVAVTPPTAGTTIPPAASTVPPQIFDSSTNPPDAERVMSIPVSGALASAMQTPSVGAVTYTGTDKHLHTPGNERASVLLHQQQEVPPAPTTMTSATVPVQEAIVNSVPTAPVAASSKGTHPDPAAAASDADDFDAFLDARTAPAKEK